MRYSSLRRELITIIPTAFLLACKNSRQSSLSQAELAGTVTPKPTQSPNPDLGNARVIEIPRPSGAPPPQIWEIVSNDPFGMLVRAAGIPPQGVAYDGLLELIIPESVFRLKMDVISPHKLINEPGSDLSLTVQLNPLDVNKRFYQWILSLGAQRPNPVSSLIRDNIDTRIFNPDTNAISISSQYRNQLFFGPTLIKPIKIS